eukprot:Selendium_serpulae@DN4239_c0_g1_i1.p1
MAVRQLVFLLILSVALAFIASVAKPYFSFRLVNENVVVQPSADFLYATDTEFEPSKLFEVSPEYAPYFPHGLPRGSHQKWRESLELFDGSGLGNMQPNVTLCNEFWMFATSRRTENEGKMICMDSLPIDDESCVVLSLGSNNIWDFEKAVFDNTKCRVDTFDCTGNFRVPERIRSRVTWHHKCVGKGTAVNPSKHRKRHKISADDNLSWLQIVELSGGKTPHLLKADIEKWECTLLEQLFESEFLPSQISFELHDMELHFSCIKKWMAEFPELNADQYPAPKMLALKALFLKANQVGYGLVFRRDNERHPCCSEFTLILRNNK